MRILGLIGGISWVSTADYYRLINQGINEQLGGINFSQCIIHSFNYADIKRNNETQDWDATYRMLLNAARHLKASGATCILLCANTMHYFAERLAAEVDLPLIHIAVETATEIERSGLKKVGLLGTKITMEFDFFKAKLAEKGIEAMIPDEEDRTFIHQTIFEELGKGIVTAETKKRYQQIIQQLADNGAEGVILGCTEIPLVIQQPDVAIPVFDTTAIHSKAAVAFSLSES